MMQILINCIYTYLLIGTFVLMNLLFNPRIDFRVNCENPNKDYTIRIAIIISIFWIKYLPKFFKRSKEDE